MLKSEDLCGWTVSEAELCRAHTGFMSRTDSGWSLGNGAVKYRCGAHSDRFSPQIRATVSTIA